MYCWLATYFPTTGNYMLMYEHITQNILRYCYFIFFNFEGMLPSICGLIEPIIAKEYLNNLRGIKVNIYRYSSRSVKV